MAVTSKTGSILRDSNREAHSPTEVQTASSVNLLPSFAAFPAIPGASMKWGIKKNPNKLCNLQETNDLWFIACYPASYLIDSS